MNTFTNIMMSIGPLTGHSGTTPWAFCEPKGHLICEFKEETEYILIVGFRRRTICSSTSLLSFSYSWEAHSSHVTLTCVLAWPKPSALSFRTSKSSRRHSNQHSASVFVLL